MPEKPEHKLPAREQERKLEQGLEETMAGSDPVSIVQPIAGEAHHRRSTQSKDRPKDRRG